MKSRFIKSLSSLCVIFALALTLSACKDNDSSTPQDNGMETPSAELVFTYSNGTITGLTDLGKTLSEISIPSEINGEKITKVSANSFKNATNITEVEIGSEVTEIEYAAFHNCDNLVNVNIPSNVKVIAKEAFSNCDKLETVILPDELTSIGSSAFYGTKYWNTSSNWDNKALYIGKYLISVNDEFNLDFNVKDGTLLIADFAFSNGKVKTVTFANSVKYVGKEAFSNCALLENVTTGSNVYEISDWAFANCSKLNTVNLGASLNSIGNSAYVNCAKLTSINFSGTVSEWNLLSKGNNWNYNVLATKVICADGEVGL